MVLECCAACVRAKSACRMTARALALIALVAATPVFGATFTVEGDTLVQPPGRVASAVERRWKSEFVDRQGAPCRFIGKPIALEPSGPAVDWVLTTADACSWAASAAPVWVVRRVRETYQVVLFHVTYELTIGSVTHNGLRNIATARATAARREDQLWKFDGERYQVTSNRVR
jgi:hypothetical protein